MNQDNIPYLYGPARYSSETAFISFALGTIILGLFLLFPDAEFLFIIGFIYTAIAFIVNTIVMICLGYYFIVLPLYREYIAIKMLLLLANIPVAAFYAYVAFLNINIF